MTGKYSVGTALTESYKPKLLLQHIFTYIIFSVVLLAYFLGATSDHKWEPQRSLKVESSYLFHCYQKGRHKPMELAAIRQQNSRNKSVRTKNTKHKNK